MKRVIKHSQESSYPTFRIDTTHITRALLLIPILVLLITMSGCMNYGSEDIGFAIIDADVALPENECDSVEDGSVDIFRNDDVSQKNRSDNFEGDQPSSTLLATPTPESSSFPSFTTNPIDVAKDFLSQFVSIFFEPYGDEPVFLIVDNWDNGWWDIYFIDGYGNVVSDAPSVQTINVEFGEGTSLALARRFRLFTVDGSSVPQIITIQYESFNFSGGGYALYKMINNGNEFLPLGSMRTYHHHGAGHDAVSITPFINESGDIITYMITDGGDFHAINSYNDFEHIAFINAHWQGEDGDTIIISIEDEYGTWHSEWLTLEEFLELLSTDQMQNIFPSFPSGSFVPMTRIYDLEQELTETITQKLRGTFPVAVQPTN